MVEKYGYCSIVASEGIKNKNKFISESGFKLFWTCTIKRFGSVLSGMVTKICNLNVIGQFLIIFKDQLDI